MTKEEMKNEEWYVILNMNCKYEICRMCPKSGLFKGSYKECEEWIKQKKKEEMKDEEKQIFEKWFEEKKEKCEVYGNGDDFWVDDEIKKFCLMGYELGLKAGRPQWHDLRKDPTDLPSDKHGHVVMNQDWDKVVIRNGRFEHLDGYKADVIKWCEIPTFDKE